MVRWGDYVERNCERPRAHSYPTTNINGTRTRHNMGFTVTRATLPGYRHPRVLVSTCPTFTVLPMRHTLIQSTRPPSAYNFDKLQQAIQAVPQTPRYEAMRRQRVTAPLLARLPADCDAVVQRALRSRDREVAVNGEEAAAVPVCADDLLTVSGSNWLNDEIVNGYLQLLIGNVEHGKSWAFNTFFMTKLQKNGHEGVARWSKSVDLFECVHVLIPVHLGNHWTLISVDNTTDTISYYDGLGGRHEPYMSMVADYLTTEAQVKRKPRKQYKLQYPRAPRQQNGYDCGVFVLAYALCILCGYEMSFSQRDMPYFRRRIAYELLTNKPL